MWQDTVIAACQFAFVPSMIPTLRSPDKPPLSTSVANSLIVGIITITHATLDLWLSVTTSTLIVLVWATLATQKLRLSRARSTRPQPLSTAQVTADM